MSNVLAPTRVERGSETGPEPPQSEYDAPQVRTLEKTLWK